jgi:redox-sensitive bicupin YhaK (pirin superfamily)
MDGEVRKIERIVEPVMLKEGAGVTVKRTIGSRKLDYLDPFLLLDDFGSENPDDFRAGFPMHPHRGIETVTYMLTGYMRHGDSLGNAGTIGPGDVQWMTAGSGIRHEEMPRPEQGGLDGFQLWVNLPAKSKMTQPRYQEFGKEQIVHVERNGARIRIIAGQVGEARGPVSEIAISPTYLDVSVPAGGRFSHAVAPGHTVFAYVFEGQGNFGPAGNGGRTVASRALVVFGDGERVEARTGDGPVRFLLVSGKPLNEPIARYGPFVMNTRDEIEQALRDLRAGTFVKTGGPDLNI